MHFLVFILAYPLLLFISILPMRVLYMLSTFFYVLFYYVIGYRKEVVLQNLQLAFPEKSHEEHLRIRKEFFKHFTDLFIESIKAFTITSRFLQKRYTYKNPELFDKYIAAGKSIALVGAHQANWEWSIGLPLHIKGITFFGAYTKLGNPYFEKVVKKSRTKFGFIGYKTSETIREMQKNFDNNIQGVYLLLSDQSPQVHKTHYWSEFLGIKVPIHTGAEMLAKKFDLVVINYVAKKVKRGHFEVTFELVTDDPKSLENYQVTDQYLNITEKNIYDQPEYYLWSHKRFKHRDKVPEKFN